MNCGPMSEPKVVIAHREHLWWLLAEALQLEHMIMCQYLFAEFSLKDGVGDGLTTEQADAVDRWRKKLRGIAIEEMLHIALVANLKSAIGVRPLAGPTSRSGRVTPGRCSARPVPFGDQALDHFLFLERPEGMERADASEFVPTARPRDPVDEHETLPRGQEYATVGHLYRGIADGLRALSSRLGERALFVGSPRAQATPELFRWPQLVAVTDLDSALAAVEEIIEQGEGAKGDWNAARYGRFLSVRQEFDRAAGRSELRAGSPRAGRLPPPTVRHPDAPAGHHRPASQSGRRAGRAGLRADPARPVAVLHPHRRDGFAARHNGGRRVTLMAKVLQPLGTELTTLPVGSAHPGRTAGFAFEMYYVMGNMTPHREPSWALLSERGRILAHRCRQVAADRNDDPRSSQTISDAAEQAQTVADALTAQVPEALRPPPGQEFPA